MYSGAGVASQDTTRFDPGRLEQSLCCAPRNASGSLFLQIVETSVCLSARTLQLAKTSALCCLFTEPCRPTPRLVENDSIRATPYLSPISEVLQPTSKPNILLFVVFRWRYFVCLLLSLFGRASRSSAFPLLFFSYYRIKVLVYGLCAGLP